MIIQNTHRKIPISSQANPNTHQTFTRIHFFSLNNTGQNFNLLYQCVCFWIGCHYSKKRQESKKKKQWKSDQSKWAFKICEYTTVQRQQRQQKKKCREKRAEHTTKTKLNDHLFAFFFLFFFLFTFVWGIECFDNSAEPFDLCVTAVFKSFTFQLFLMWFQWCSVWFGFAFSYSVSVRVRCDFNFLIIFLSLSHTL